MPYSHTVLHTHSHTLTHAYTGCDGCDGCDAGTSWVGCVGEGESRHSNESYVRPAAFERDYGTPIGLCEESSTSPNVFTRKWTKAVATTDCNTGKSSVQLLEQ